MIDPIIKAICQQEGINALSIQPLAGGQTNSVYRIGKDYILRIASTPEDGERLANEARSLQKVPSTIPIPHILALGTYSGQTYQLQRFIPGERMHHLWRHLSHDQKESVIAQHAGYLKPLHEVTFSEYGWMNQDEAQFGFWNAFCEEQFYTTIETLSNPQVLLPDDVIQHTIDFFEFHKTCLQEGPPVFVHGDLWPGNILVAGDCISGVLDFEFAMQAPLDYELLLIEEFCLYPNDFAEEDWEIFSTADFADLFLLLRKHYPALFSIPGLRQRLDLYHLMYALRSFVDWRLAHPEDRTYPTNTLARLFNILFRHGVRMV